MVTHEHDIAAHAKRLVTLRDGRDRERPAAGRPLGRGATAAAARRGVTPMNVREAIRVALEMIRAHKLRAFFTVLGTVVGRHLPDRGHHPASRG